MCVSLSIFYILHQAYSTLRLLVQNIHHMPGFIFTLTYTCDRICQIVNNIVMYGKISLLELKTLNENVNGIRQVIT